METYSYCAWLPYGQKILFTEEAVEIGPLLPGGTFHGGKILPKDPYTMGISMEETICEMAMHKIKEKLKKDLKVDKVNHIWSRMQMPDTITRMDGSKISITKMYAFDVSMTPKDFESIRKKARIPVMLLDYSDIKGSVRSEATLEMAKDYFGIK